MPTIVELVPVGAAPDQTLGAPVAARQRRCDLGVGAVEVASRAFLRKNGRADGMLLYERFRGLGLSS